MESDQLLRIFQRYRYAWIALGTLLIINLLAYSVLVRAQRQKIINLEQQYGQIRKKGSAVGRNTGLRQYVAARKDLESFRHRLPPRSDFAVEVGRLYDELSRHGLTVGTVTFNPEKSGPLSLWKFSTVFTVSGRYDQLKSFLAGLQNMSHLYCIEGLSFSGGSKETDNLKLKLKLSIYLS